MAWDELPTHMCGPYNTTSFEVLLKEDATALILETAVQLQSTMHSASLLNPAKQESYGQGVHSAVASQCYAPLLQSPRPQ